MTDWGTISTDELIFRTQDGPSCILENQKLKLADGTKLSAVEIFEAVKNGIRIDFRTPRIDRHGDCANPVVGAIKTFAKSKRVTFTDGRLVELTSGHVLPVSGETLDAFDDPGENHFKGRNEEICTLPVYQQEIIRVGQVRPGMKLLDGEIAEIRDLGKKRAVRLWTYHPAWIPTDEGLSIGTRWHEILFAWAELKRFKGLIFNKAENFVSATGWTWSDGKGGEFTFPIGRNYVTNLPQRSGGLASPFKIRELFENDMGIYVDKFEKKARSERLFNSEQSSEFISPSPSWADDPRIKAQLMKTRKPRLVLSSPKELQKRLISGIEIVGEPIFAPEFKAA